MLKKIKGRISIAQMHLLLLFVLLICIFQYGITKIYGMYLFPDEFGYWASAATALGYDWSEIAALGSYYSFGYSAVLLPILKSIENATDAYRTAILLNAIFSGISLYLIYHILTKVFKKTENRIIACISGIAIFFPSCIYYMQMTMTESLLTVLFVVISTVLLHYIENPRSSTAVWLAVLLIYIYFVHMRTIGIVGACCLTLIMLAAWNKKYVKTLLVFGATICIMAVIGIVLKQLVTGTLYSAATAASLAANDYAGQVGKIASLFCFEGIYRFVTSCVGKLFYLGSATFGLFYWGIYFLVTKMTELFRQIRRKEEIRMHSMWFLFLLLAVSFHFMISAVYMMEHAPNGRIDTLIYGRYNEMLVPVMIGIGIMAMFESKHLIKQTAVIILLQGIFAPLVYYFIRARELTELYTCHVIAISYAVNEADFHIELFILNVYLVSSLIGVLLTGIIICIRKKNEFYWLFIIVIAIEVLIGLSVSRNNIYTQNEANFRDYELAESITALERPEKEIIFLNAGGTTYVDLMQFCLRDTRFTVIEPADIRLEQLEADDLILVDRRNTNIEELGKKLEERYDSSLDSGHFDLYYNTDEKRISK